MRWSEYIQLYASSLGGIALVPSADRIFHTLVLGMTVRKRGNQFVLLSRTGKVLGTHPSRKAAERQESAINISKAKKSKKK